MFAAAAATGILSLSGTPALADSTAVAAAEDSSGLLSGNNVQVPVSVPVNVCGNTVGVIAALNRASDNSCGNVSYEHGSSGSSYGSPAGGAKAVASTEDSHGLLSGNNVQAPVSAPVNVCGNTVDVIAALNHASDNSCGNASYEHGSSGSSYGSPAGGAKAVASTEDSYGLLSGNNVQAPVELPVNVCGNTVDVIAALNHAYGNSCGNSTDRSPEPGYGTEDETPPKTCDDDCETPPSTSAPTPPPTRGTVPPPSVGVEEPGKTPQMAETGSEGMLAASAAGVALLTGGALLYRRGRAASQR